MKTKRDVSRGTPEMMFWRLFFAVFAAFAPVVGGYCAAVEGPQAVSETARLTNVFYPEKLAAIDQTILQAITNKETPGGVLWLERQGVVYVKSYGYRALIPAKELATVDTIYDAASLTKVLATAPAIMILVERGQLELDKPVSNWIPEFTGGEREKITLRHLLTHTSGLPSGLTRRNQLHDHASAVAQAVTERVNPSPGQAFRYSDVNFILLGEIVRRVSGKPLNEFAMSEIFEPLGMKDTRYLPPAAWRERIAPTEQSLRGVVHDPTARAMGGVAGHAGVFTTAADLARYCRMMLNGGELDGRRVLKPETVKLMTSVQSPPEVKQRRGLGWDIDSPYAGPRGKVFPVGSYGHTGWTGPSMWIDPFSKTFVLFLCNRNHPDGKGNVVKLRSLLGTLAAEAVRNFDFTNVPGALPRLQEPAKE